ncbi:GNAT family N-acetyltransferase [Roseateles violae]|uniref:GNAT family N-acetyltransferase n=1 Tax=Roseateles violae TaxID=3058042 RepID=A0ABT8DKR9_9BURK|nr:GNAT family N-acetyltransferase [Pelomonas sp. PFR6]MDN3919002.1 GNAT family N-acetyltransferase [Pelomonas sp. PFR6]
MRELASARLRLEPQLAEHAPAMFVVLSDPALYAYENAPPDSVEALRQRYLRLESRRSPDGRQLWLNWVLREQASAALIGYVQASVAADSTAIAYELGSTHWGRGLAFEACSAMIEELARQYRAQRLHAMLKRANWRSLRLLGRLGFVEATRAQRLARNGLAADELLMLRELPAADTPAADRLG